MKISAPDVTVLVLTYNQEDTIARTLDSILAQQGNRTFEIIIGDDASADSTRDVCEDYARRFPDIVRLMPAMPNKGLVINYFDCLAAARGRYIADCAGDDYWCDDRKIDAMCRMLDEYPGATVVFSDAVLEWPDGRREKAPAMMTDRIVEGKRIMDTLLNNTDTLPYILSTAIYRKEVIDNALMENREMVCNKDFGIEDVPVIAALAAAGDAVRYDHPTLVYSQSDESVSNSLSPSRQARFYSRVLECTRRLAEYYKISEDAMKANFRSKAKYIAAMAFDSGDPEVMSLVSETLSRWNLPLPITARLHLAAFGTPFFGSIIRAMKRFRRRR